MGSIRRARTVLRWPIICPCWCLLPVSRCGGRFLLLHWLLPLQSLHPHPGVPLHPPHHHPPPPPCPVILWLQECSRSCCSLCPPHPLSDYFCCSCYCSCCSCCCCCSCC